MLKTFHYETIAHELRQQIAGGGLQNKLPSERVLMARYNVHRNTVRRALSVLADEGRILSLPKSGSFVNPDFVSHRVTGSVLVIAPWNNASTALENLLRGLGQSLGASGLSVRYFDSRPKPGVSKNLLPDAAYLNTHDVKGIVLWPQSPTDVRALSRLREFAPVVLVDREVPGFETHSVVFDDFAGAFAATTHLIQVGHRRIGFLTDEVWAETVQQRWRGYIEAMETGGGVTGPACWGLFEGFGSPTHEARMRLLLEGGGRPLTAMVCSNDTVAMAFMGFLQTSGLRVPDDIAVTGFGNLLPNSTEAARLTTVLQPFEFVGQAIGGLLLECTAPNAPPERGDYKHIEIPVELIVRGSSTPHAP